MIKSIALRLPTECNLNCQYCYGNLKTKADSMTLKEIQNVVKQSYDLGAEIVYIVGEGEPLLYENFKELIQYINLLGMVPVVYSNCIRITQKLAKFLFDQNARIIGKQNALNPKVQDEICRTPGSYLRMMKGIQNLIKIGFTENHPSRLEIHTVILRNNLHDLPKMWRGWRKQNILPQAQVLVYPSKNHDKQFFDYYSHHVPSPSETRALFEELSRIDKKEFGIKWDPVLAYPIAPIGCQIHCDGIGVSQEGNIQICSYLEDSLGNIREKKLIDILNDRKVDRIRSMGMVLHYPGNSYGCRANAFNLTGDRFKRDPYFDDFLCK